MIGMQVHLLPLGSRERSGLRPDAIGDAYTTDIVEVRSDFETGRGSAIQAAVGWLSPRERCDVRSVAMCEWILEIGQLPESASDVWQVRFGYSTIGDGSASRIRTRGSPLVACVTIVSLADARCATTAGSSDLPRAVSQRAGEIANAETEQLGSFGSHASIRAGRPICSPRSERCRRRSTTHECRTNCRSRCPEVRSGARASCHLAARLIVSLSEGAAGHGHAYSSAHTR